MFGTNLILKNAFRMMSWAGSGTKRVAEKELHQRFSPSKKKQQQFCWPCPVCHRSFASYLLDDHIHHCCGPSNSLSSVFRTSPTDGPKLITTEPPSGPVSIDIFSILQSDYDTPSLPKIVNSENTIDFRNAASSEECDRPSGSCGASIQPDSDFQLEDGVSFRQKDLSVCVDRVPGSGNTAESSIENTKSLNSKLITDGLEDMIKFECNENKEVPVETRAVVARESMEQQGSAEVLKDGNGRREWPPPGFKLYQRQKQSQAKLSMFFKHVSPAGVESNSPVTVLQAGMVLFKNWLSLERQQMLVQESQNVAHLFHRPITSGGGKYHIYSMCWGPKWNPKTHRYAGVGAEQPLPDWMFDLAQEICCEAQRHTPVHPPDLKFTPDVALANFYPVKDKELGVIGIGGHQDLDDSCKMPVVSISVGDSMTFFYRRLPPLSRRKSMIYVSVDEKAAKNCVDGDTAHNREQQLILRSGDVLVFGGESRLIYHGTRHVQAGTRPPGLHMVSGRLNFTFRQTDGSLTAQHSHSSS
ncbi:hypothetical protein R1flu_027001 [Riccia fluitans]|uniref:Fe2OG dioxygenase domain-containing protein n=1 Tax=Riccia fluitans TaxID=41844 RepID=A0ABD1XLM5_9MARC